MQQNAEREQYLKQQQADRDAQWRDAEQTFKQQQAEREQYLTQQHAEREGQWRDAENHLKCQLADRDAQWRDTEIQLKHQHSDREAQWRDTQHKLNEDYSAREASWTDAERRIAAAEFECAAQSAKYQGMPLVCVHGSLMHYASLCELCAALMHCAPPRNSPRLSRTASGA